MTLLEYSVIYTNRTINLMSKSYKNTMKQLTTNLCQVYNAKKCVIIPGSGTSAMESVARQYITPHSKSMIIRNGYFSYRWNQIIESYQETPNIKVLKGLIHDNQVLPPNIDEVITNILEYQPDIVCTPQVETSTGLILNQDYLRKIGNSVREVDGLFCLDGIAAGTLWVDMEKLGIDIFITAPQKGWSSPAGCGVVLLGERALDKLNRDNDSSFSLNLSKWLDVSNSYENDGFMYHCTVPTETITKFNENVQEALDIGLDKLEDRAIYLGYSIRDILANYGYLSVAKKNCASPTVIVSYANENMIPKFLEVNVQVTGFTPFMLNEPNDINTFRVGLFGFDKLRDVDKTIMDFKNALDNINNNKKKSNI